MARVELTRRAHADLGRLRRWLADKNPEAAERAARAIIDGLMGLGVFPLMGARAASGGGRELAIDFGRDGYVARYRVDGDRVVVTRIFHAREQR
jgi:plasmid stabilization system protein ParE